MSVAGIEFNLGKYGRSKPVPQHNINTFWVNNVKHHSNMVLHIDAMTDHFGAFEQKSITFHCHPKM